MHVWICRAESLGGGGEVGGDKEGRPVMGVGMEGYKLRCGGRRVLIGVFFGGVMAGGRAYASCQGGCGGRMASTGEERGSPCGLKPTSCY